jgi:hypothetical protein
MRSPLMCIAPAQCCCGGEKVMRNGILLVVYTMNTCIAVAMCYKNKVDVIRVWRGTLFLLRQLE